MGGEWNMMSIMEEAEVVCISGTDGVDRIYPPKQYRQHNFELINKGGKRLDIVLATCALHYRWPKMRNDIITHVSNCKPCFASKPSKTEAKHPGLSIPLEDLSPMDWLCCDLMAIKDKKGKSQTI